MINNTVGGLSYTEHTLTVPLVWDDPADPRTIDVFARVVTKPGGEGLPYLVFLQGGPGMEAPRPNLPSSPGWLGTALERYQVVMLDQRGTGRSTPVTDALLARPAAEVVERLTHLRADAIVRDAEAVRELLGVRTWSVLGQSFGGFTTLAYLSTHADAVDQAYITGGLSAVGRHCDEVYARTWTISATKSREHYTRFPGDREKVRRLVDLAAEGELILPDGEVVSPSRLRSLGMLLGTDEGTWTLHWLLDLDPLGNAFTHDLAHHLPFGGRNPLYAVIHESSYADGCTTAWSAGRTRPGEFDDDPTLLSAEHVDREWFSNSVALRPWAQVADLLAQHPWPRLYDAEVLRASGARGAAAVYATDLYVPLELSLETAALLPGVHPYVTSEHEHNGLRSSNGAVLRHLFELASGERLR
jgi:pimeloyl-ACP methyl ester carboxylesterase